MSVVVIRNGIIAADTGGLMGGLKVSAGKLRRDGDTVIGWAGNWSHGMLFARWYFEGSDLENLPEFHNQEEGGVDFCAIVFDPGGWAYWDQGFVGDRDMADRNEYMAIGSGEEAAMGALHMGATAVQAVGAACATIGGCSLPVEWEAVGQPNA